jgi:LPXTG-site transpeptidase (sortase) family protein
LTAVVAPPEAAVTATAPAATALLAAHASPVARAREIGARVVTKRNVALLIGVLILAALFERGVAPAMARYQQQHRVSDFLHRRPTITTGDSFAVLQIESLALDKIVAEGDTRTILRGGPGHVSSTPAPGEAGNAVFVGRSSRFGADFSGIGGLKKGAAIVVQMRGGVAPIRYLVEEVATIGPKDPLPASSAAESVTLVTSAGGVRSDRRTVVVAGRDGAAARDANAPATAALPPTPTSSSESIALVVWGAAVVALIAVARRVRAAARRVSPALFVALLPIVGTVLFKLALAMDALLPPSY